MSHKIENANLHGALSKRHEFENEARAVWLAPLGLEHHRRDPQTRCIVDAGGNDPLNPPDAVRFLNMPEALAHSERLVADSPVYMKAGA